MRVGLSFGFQGEECGLPIEAARRLFEFFLFFQDVEGVGLIDLIIFTLKLQLDHIMTLSDFRSLFGYVSQGQFLRDCFLTESLYEKVLTDFLAPLNEAFMPTR